MDKINGWLTGKRIWGVLAAEAIVIVTLSFVAFKAVTKPPSGSFEAVLKTSNLPPSNIDTSSASASYNSFATAGIKEFTDAEKAKTLDALTELTKGFKVKPAFMEDKSNALIALGIAHLAVTATPAEKEGYRYEMYLLAWPYLDGMPSGITDEDQANQLSNDQAKQVYAKYTDAALTKQLGDAIASRNLLADQNKRLGIAGATTPYELRALNFAEKSDQEKAFAADLKQTGWVPPLWNDKRQGFNYIAFTKTQANNFLSANDDTTKALILHEYTHSQPNFIRGSGLTLALEEYRAEHFSGSKGAYYDVKQFIIYLNVFAGYDASAVMEQAPTKADDFYINMYKQLGVDAANRVVVASPNLYLQNAATPLKKVQTLTDGYNGALLAAYGIGQRNNPAVTARVKARADKLISVLGSKSAALADLQNNTAKTYKLDYAAKVMTDYINAHY